MLCTISVSVNVLIFGIGEFTLSGNRFTLITRLIESYFCFIHWGSVGLVLVPSEWGLEEEGQSYLVYLHCYEGGVVRIGGNRR